MPVPIPAPGDQTPGSTSTLLADPGGTVIKRTVTDSGVRVMTEAMPATRSATIGIWVPVGSRDEKPRYAGASHFLEHLLFKGTANRSALEISAAIDAVGGDLNAFTAREYTCYYARVIDRDLALAVDVLIDMVCRSLVTKHDVESERQVVIEEIAMHDDDPAGVAQEMFTAQVYRGTALATPIVGSVESIGAMPRTDVVRHYRRWYRPDNLAVVAAGGLDHEDVVTAVEKSLALGGNKTGKRPMALRRSPGGGASGKKRPTRHERHRDIEQANLVMGHAGLNRTDPRRHTLGVLNAAVGGGMSSRLFQEIRERRGLAYSVQSFTSAYSDNGAFGVYAGTTPTKLDQTLEIVSAELAKVASGGLTTEEIDRGKGQLSGGLVLSLEESSSRMVTLGEAELVTGRIMPVSESMASIDAVTADGVAALAQEIFSTPQHVAVVGPEHKKKGKK